MEGFLAGILYAILLTLDTYINKGISKSGTTLLASLLSDKALQGRRTRRLPIMTVYFSCTSTYGMLHKSRDDQVDIYIQYTYEQQLT
jgi:hypothetical protein